MYPHRSYFVSFSSELRGEDNNQFVNNKAETAAILEAMWWSHLKHRFINFWPHLNTKIIGCRLPVPQSQLPVDSGRVQRLSSRVAGNKRFHLAPKMSCGIGGVRKMNLVNGKWDALVETCPQQNYQVSGSLVLHVGSAQCGRGLVSKTSK